MLRGYVLDQGLGCPFLTNVVLRLVGDSPDSERVELVEILKPPGLCSGCHEWPTTQCSVQPETLIVFFRNQLCAIFLSKFPSWLGCQRKGVFYGHLAYAEELRRHLVCGFRGSEGVLIRPLCSLGAANTLEGYCWQQ